MARKSKTNGAAEQMADVAANTADGTSNAVARKTASDIFYAIMAVDSDGSVKWTVERHRNIWRARKRIPDLLSAMLALGQRVELVVWKCRPVSEETLKRRRTPRQ